MMNNPYRFVWHRFVQWIRASFSFLWLALLAGYLIVLAAQAVIHTYQSRQEIQALKNKLVSMKLEQQKLSALLVYYNTDEFKEKELRQSLILKKPNERMLALPESSAAHGAEEELLTQQALQKAESNKVLWHQWVDYLLHGDAGKS